MNAQKIKMMDLYFADGASAHVMPEDITCMNVFNLFTNATMIDGSLKTYRACSGFEIGIKSKAKWFKADENEGKDTGKDLATRMERGDVVQVRVVTNDGLETVFLTPYTKEKKLQKARVFQNSVLLVAEEM